MAGQLGELYVVINAKIDDLQKALGEVKKELGGTQQEVKKADSSFGGLWKQFAIGQLAADAVKKAIGFLTDTLKASIQGAMESEQSEKNLETALASTGRTVEKLLPQYLEFSKAQSRHVKYTDEEINAAQALLVQMTRLDTQGIQQATKGAMGLAAVMGISLQSATMMVTKAMEGNYGALGRVGIQVNENLSLQEKNAELLRQLGTLYARAEAETQTFGGALGQLKKEWGELLEEAGKIITQNPEVVGAINDVKQVIIDLIESGDLKEWAEEAGKAITTLAQVVRDAMGALKNLIPAAFQVINQELNNLKTSAFLAAAAWAFLTKRSGEYQEYLYNLKREFLDMNKVMGDHDIKLDDVATATNETGNKTAVYTKEMKAAADAVKKHKDELKNFKTGLADLSSTIGESTSFMKLWGAQVQASAIDAATFGDAAIEIGRKMDEIPKAAEPAITMTKNYFDGLYNDIATGWANTIQKWLEGTTTFKDFLLGIWGDIKSAFFRVIGEMAAEWAVGLIKNLVTGAAEAAGSAAASLSEAVASTGSIIASIAQGLAGAVVAIAKGVATAATIIAASAKEILIAAGIALAIKSAFEIIGGIIGSIFGKGDGKQTDVTYWLKMIKDNSQIIVNYLADTLVPATHNIEMLSYNMRDFLNDIKLTSWDQTQKLYEIAENTHGTWAALKNVTKGAGGIDMTVSKPTLFMAGEGSKTERVTINPNLNVSSAPVVINLDGRAIAHAIVKFFPEMGRNKMMRIHSNAMVGY